MTVKASYKQCQASLPYSSVSLSPSDSDQSHSFSEKYWKESSSIVMDKPDKAYSFKLKFIGTYLFSLLQLLPVVFCKALPTSIVNGTVSGSQYSYAKKVTFSCASGYFITGGLQTVTQRVLQCQDDGLWSAATPSCSRKSSLYWANGTFLHKFAPTIAKPWSVQAQGALFHVMPGTVNDSCSLISQYIPIQLKRQ